MLHYKICYLNRTDVTLINGYGQNDILVLKNRISGKEKIINQGRRIKINSFDGKEYIGKLEIKNDTNIIIGNNQVALNKIKEIDIKPIFVNL